MAMMALTVSSHGKGMTDEFLMQLPEFRGSWILRLYTVYPHSSMARPSVVSFIKVVMFLFSFNSFDLRHPSIHLIVLVNSIPPLYTVLHRHQVCLTFHTFLSSNQIFIRRWAIPLHLQGGARISDCRPSP